MELFKGFEVKGRQDSFISREIYSEWPRIEWPAVTLDVKINDDQELTYGGGLLAKGTVTLVSGLVAELLFEKDRKIHPECLYSLGKELQERNTDPKARENFLVKRIWDSVIKRIQSSIDEELSQVSCVRAYGDMQSKRWKAPNVNTKSYFHDLMFQAIRIMGTDIPTPENIKGESIKASIIQELSELKDKIGAMRHAIASHMKTLQESDDAFGDIVPTSIKWQKYGAEFPMTPEHQVKLVSMFNGILRHLRETQEKWHTYMPIHKRQDVFDESVEG